MQEKNDTTKSFDEPSGMNFSENKETVITNAVNKQMQRKIRNANLS